MKVLVLGGTGFIGRHVVGQLNERGHDVVVFHRGSTGAALPTGVRAILGDRHDLPTRAGEIEQLRADVVIDIIPYTEREAREVRDTFRGFVRRLVVLSSGDVYRNYEGLRRVGAAPPDPWPLKETSPLRANLFPYRANVRDASNPMFDYEKILVERVVMNDADLPGTVLRLPMVYGPGDPQHRLFPYLKRMDDGRPRILLGKGQESWRSTRGFVENVAAAVVVAAIDDRAAGRVYNIGDRNAPTEAEWIAALGGVAGWSGAIEPLPLDRLPAGIAPDFDWRYHLATDTDQIRAHLGFVEPVLKREALMRSIDWQRRHQPTRRRSSQAPSISATSFDYAAEDAAFAA